MWREMGEKVGSGEERRTEELDQRYCQCRVFPPTLSRFLSRMAFGFGACTWRVLAGTERILV